MLILLSLYLYKFQLRPRMGKITAFLKSNGFYYAFRPSLLKPASVILSSK
jgi:hypothetical protein